jgi:hypothetical protein
MLAKIWTITGIKWQLFSILSLKSPPEIDAYNNTNINFGQFPSTYIHSKATRFQAAYDF